MKRTLIGKEIVHHRMGEVLDHLMEMDPRAWILVGLPRKDEDMQAMICANMDREQIADALTYAGSTMADGEILTKDTRTGKVTMESVTPKDKKTQKRDAVERAMDLALDALRDTDKTSDWIIINRAEDRSVITCCTMKSDAVAELLGSLSRQKPAETIMVEKD